MHLYSNSIQATHDLFSVTSKNITRKKSIEIPLSYTEAYSFRVSSALMY